MHRSPYTDLVHHLRTANTGDPSLSKRLSELLSLNELVTTLHSIRSLEGILDVVLLTILGEFPSRIGAIMICKEDGWSAPLVKGTKKIPERIALPAQDLICSSHRVIDLEGAAEVHQALANLMQEYGFEYLFPMRSDMQLAGLIGLGGCIHKAEQGKIDLIATIADFAGVVLGNYLYRAGLERANRQLQRRIFQLNTLYEIAGSFARCYEREHVYDVLARNLMGHFFISRCVVLEIAEQTQLAYIKGIRDDGSAPAVNRQDIDHKALSRLHSRDQLDSKELVEYMKPRRLRYANSIEVEGRLQALILLGGRLDGRPLHDEDLDFLESLIQQAAVALENQSLQLEVVEKKRMEKELELAREIQQRLLPKRIPAIAGYDIAVDMRPFQQVGGDFYDIIPMEDGRVVLCMADVSGKSLPASMIMSTTQASLRALTSFSGLQPDEVLGRLNNHIYESTQNNKYVTMFFAVLDPANHQLSYINAGHNRPLFKCKGHEIRELDRGGMVVGMFPNVCYEVETVTLEADTEILVFTDGLSEIVDGLGEEYGELRLEQFLLSERGNGSAESRMQAIMNDVLTFGANRMIDDLTIMVVRRTA